MDAPFGFKHGLDPDLFALDRLGDLVKRAPEGRFVAQLADTRPGAPGAGRDVHDARGLARATTSRGAACTLHFDNLEEWAPEYAEAGQGRARAGALARALVDDPQPEHRHPRVLGRRAGGAPRRRQHAGQLRRRRSHAVAFRAALEPHADRDRVAHARRHVPRLARARAGPDLRSRRRRRVRRAAALAALARAPRPEPRPSRSSSPTGRPRRSASARSTTSTGSCAAPSSPRSRPAARATA